MKKSIDPDTGTILLCAMRYALGRETYMPGIVQDYIRRHKDELDLRTVSVMIRDIREADRISVHKLSDGSEMKIDGMGHTQIDRPGWLRLLAWLEELERELKHES